MILVECSSLEAGRGKALASHPFCVLLPHRGPKAASYASPPIKSHIYFGSSPVSHLWGTVCPALPRVPSYKDKGSEGPAGL